MGLHREMANSLYTFGERAEATEKRKQKDKETATKLGEWEESEEISNVIHHESRSLKWAEQRS